MAVVGCAVSETLSMPKCAADGGSVIITAQSVPSASLLPCLDQLPQGWLVDSVSVSDTGTTVVFDSDRAGSGAAQMHYAASCDIGDAVSTPTDHEGTNRFEDVTQVSPRFVGDRYYRFDGGCLWWEFDFDSGAPSALSVELGAILDLVDRQVVSDDLRETFIDEDL